MVFSSISFLIFFLPILFIIYFAVPMRFRRGRNFILLTASLIFYGWGGVKYLLLLLCSVAINYIGGLAVTARGGKRKKLSLILSVLLNVGILGYFKYAMFFMRSLSFAGLPVSVPDIALPIGISFFTFQGMSYVIDVYRGDAAVQKNLLNVALYVALFPQLVAGPIVRYTTVADDINGRRETFEDFSNGLVRFFIGLGKKMIIANSMGEVADAVFAKAPGEMSVLLAWVGIVSYTLQIYFDFSAYSDMAIGLGKAFGFRFLENFNYPYISRSVTEFWRRWHMSLSSWFRDYVYFPLGGSRCSVGKNIRNLAAVWLLTGLWHGADWTFVIWGLWFLLFLILEKFLLKNLLPKLPGAVCHIYTLLVVMLSWVLFRSDSLAGAVRYAGVMFGVGSAGLVSGEAVYYLKLYLPQFIIGIIAAMPVKIYLENKLKEGNRVSRFVLEWFPKAFALSMLAISYVELVTGSFNPFIYFQF